MDTGIATPINQSRRTTSKEYEEQPFIDHSNGVFHYRRGIHDHFQAQNIGKSNRSIPACTCLATCTVVASDPFETESKVSLKTGESILMVPI